MLENTQFALIATVHKLYAMVRNQQPWDLGEPELNDRGQPIIHNIASKLGCIRPNSDMDLPVHSVFPEDEAGLNELARQLEDQQQKEVGSTSTGNAPVTGSKRQHETDSISCARTDRASSSELDHSDFEQDYRKTAFRSGVPTLSMSPQSLSYSDFDHLSSSTTTASSAAGGPTSAAADGGFPGTHSPIVPSNYGTAAPWMGARTAADFATQQHFLAAAAAAPYLDMDVLSQGLVESNFGTIKPHVLSCPNPDVMMGMGDPMMYSGYDAESLRL